jgi:hypothetical protein
MRRSRAPSNTSNVAGTDFEEEEEFKDDDEEEETLSTATLGTTQRGDMPSNLFEEEELLKRTRSIRVKLSKRGDVAARRRARSMCSSNEARCQFNEGVKTMSYSPSDSSLTRK